MQRILPIILSFFTIFQVCGAENRVSLVQPVKNHDSNRVRLLLQGENVDVNERDTTENRCTLMHYAIQPLLGQYEVATNEAIAIFYMLMTYPGYEPNAQDSLGNTVLHYMAAFGCAVNSLKSFLMTKNLNIELANRAGLTPLSLADDNRNYEIAAMLKHTIAVKNQKREKKENSILAFLLGLHPRFGEKSMVQNLPKYLVQDILLICRQEPDMLTIEDIRSIAAKAQKELIHNVCTAIEYQNFFYQYNKE